MSNPTEQLQLLREFVGTTVYTETSLVDCLRQCGYNVERAAEQLVTGQYRPSSGNNISNNNDKKPAAKQRISSSSSAVGARAPASAPPATTTANRIAIRGVSTSRSCLSSKKTTPAAVLSASATTTAITSSATPRVSLDSLLAEPPDDGPYQNAWLLGERWISECLCNCRRGSIRYQEVLTLSHTRTGPACILFKGSSAEGTLPATLAALMVPLMRYHDEATTVAETGSRARNRPPLLLLRAESLYEDNDLCTGSLVPIKLKMYLPDPKTFFELFLQEQDVSEGTTAKVKTSMFFEARAKKNKKRLPLTEAAFGLLQYAEYGDVPKFEAPAVAETASTVDESEEDEVGDELIDEEENTGESADEAAKELDTNIDFTGAAVLQLPEADDPPGFAPGMTLRSYQRQALYWMWRRETQECSRQEQEDQISLLKELADCESVDKQTTRPYSPGKENRGHIYCDCGPVVVSDKAQQHSRTIDGQLNPVSHPLWKQRYLASASMSDTITFYVNEVFGVATHQPPDPPKSCSGGILADTMGLGKTIIVLALILQEKAERLSQTDMVILDAPTTSLVVVKLSLLQQWEQEIKTKTNLSVYIYHDCVGSGTIRKTLASDLANVDIVLTTYAVLQGETKRKQPALMQFPWLRVVLDEAHSIKNHQTLASKAACELNTVFRWACTGTIVHNGLEDVFGLMKFLGHEPWCWPSFWKAAIAKPWNSGSEEDDTRQAMNKALVLPRVKKLLGPIMIRRTKDMVQLELPPVDTQVIKVDFSQAERLFYEAVLERSNEIFDAFVDKGTAEKSYLKILSMITRLRQTCNHMYLTVRSKIDDDAITDIEEGPSKVAEKAKDTDMGDDALGRSFFENLLRKVQTATSPRKKQAEDSLEGPSKRAKDNAYLSQMVQGLTAVVRKNASHVPDECPICLETPLIQNAVISPCGHIFCKHCLVQYLRNKEDVDEGSNKLHDLIPVIPDGECPCCNKSIKARKIVELTKSETTDGGTTFSSKYLAEQRKEPPRTIKQEVRETQEGNPFAVARQMLAHAASGIDKDSSKLTAVVDELYKVWAMDPGSKVLIFSHYLGFLDMLSAKLKSDSIPCFRFDGSLSAKERFEVLQAFALCQPDAKLRGDSQGLNNGAVLLMSMAAGAEGLNLMVASSCFIVEPWWNSAKEDQCVNRIHRIGQTAPIVRVRKFIVNDSVEEQIMKMQRSKKGIADELYSEAGDGETSGSRLSLDDFKLIFRSNK